MVIKNSTPWQTEDLRMLFRRCIREVEKVEKPKTPFHQRNKEYHLDILNSTTGLRGRATIGGNIYRGYWAMIKIPIFWSSKEEIDLEYRKNLARIMIHEYYHNLGVKSIDARNYRADFTRNWNVDWVSDYPIRKKEIAKKELVDIKLKRYQRAIQNLHKAETRFRRAKTLHNKWLTKVRRYQKVYNFN